MIKNPISMSFDPDFPIPYVDPLPTKIDPCTIIDTVLEIRFESEISWSLLPGIFSLAIKNDFEKVVTLAVNEVPESVRQSEPKLQFQPHLEFLAHDCKVRLGPKLMSLNFSADYPRWSVVRQKMHGLVESLKTVFESFKITRLGLRYVDFFDGEFSPNLRLAVKIDEETIAPPALTTVMILQKDIFTCRIEMHSKAKKQNHPTDGTVLDVDISTKGDQCGTLADCLTWYDKAHLLNKKVFFGLIKEDVLKNQFNPVY